jgi:hypothetical protein
MKSVRKVIRHKLSEVQNNEHILLGLVSAEPDYKLTLSINKKFGLSLKNISPIILLEDNKSEFVYSRFSNNITNDNLIVDLISNRSGKNYLINKLKNIDFLLRVHTSKNEGILNNITLSLREIEIITAVFNIDINVIKDKNLHHLTQ